MTTMTLELPQDSAALQPRILIADDQQDVLEALRLLLKGHGYSTQAVTSPSALLDAVALRDFDLILMDLNYARDTTSGREGLDLLASLQAVENAPPIVVMTGWATVGLAVEAMQHGVGDFVEKPWVNSRLLEILKKQIEQGRARREDRLRVAREIRAQSEALSQLHERDLEIEEVRAIQQGLLPREIPQMAGFEIADAWQPARIVGGDYLDVLSFGADSLGLCIADVAGKGLPAAILMSNLQAALRGTASPALAPDELCRQLNSFLCRNIASDRFITFFYAQLDGPSRRLHYTNAGHNPPIVFRADGSHHRLRDGGGVLGVFPAQEFSSGAVTLAPGDRLILFTDGVTEACNPNGEEFGDLRLVRLLEENRSVSAAALQKKILDAVGHFCRGQWEDDATLIVLVCQESLIEEPEVL